MKRREASEELSRICVRGAVRARGAAGAVMAGRVESVVGRKEAARKGDWRGCAGAVVPLVSVPPVVS
ncbi:MAG TPA: hypothetical protein VF234_04725 [Limnochordia bacterium]